MSLISKIFREQERCTLHTMDISRCKSVETESMANKTRKEHGQGLYSDATDIDDFQHEDSAEGYFAGMELYMPGLSHVGVKKRDDTPKDKEVMASDSTKYVMVPHDTVSAHLDRARVWVRQFPYNQRLAKLKAQDLLDRQGWTKRIRMSDNTQTLGEVIRDVFTENKTFWKIEKQAQGGS